MTGGDTSVLICYVNKTIQLLRKVYYLWKYCVRAEKENVESRRNIMYLKILTVFLYLHFLFDLTICLQPQQSVISFEPSSISITTGQNYHVNVRLLIPDIIPPDVFIMFLYNDKLADPQGYIQTLPNITFTKQAGDDLSRMIIVNGHRQGHLVVTAQSPQVNISSQYDFLLIDIARSRTLSILVQLVGWIYFFAWSISFYPQIILNFRRQSVVGLNFDFLALNILGFSCYSIFNVCLYTSHDIQQQYYTKHPHGVLPVLLNDVRPNIHSKISHFPIVNSSRLYSVFMLS